ncbi:MAG: hypothetical protein K2N56_04715 [Oscillospiraceae bacterium]|nr:hypothetical protein [Oscillospiraceae bacterium]
MNDKHPHPDHHDDHEHDHDHKKKKKKEKRGRRHGGLVLFLLLALIILIALVWFFRNGFGLGPGTGDQTGTSNPSDASTPVSSDNSTGYNSDITQIRIEKNDIYIGSELCADENVLKERVIAAGSGKKYELVHDSAIKETYDKVKQVMLELKDALDLDVNFNE